MVKIHVVKISFNTNHLTFDTLSLAPAPIMDILTTWLVLTGPPKNDAVIITNAEANCEVKL
jgi:hypothetical protein